MVSGFFTSPKLQLAILSGEAIEQLAAEQILVALEPASLELSLAAAERIETHRGEVERHWQLRLERARQEADRAFRQYDAAEPENRLVSRTLESRWEAALCEVRTLTEEYDRFRASRSLTLSPAERHSIEQLSTNLPRLWNAPSLAVGQKRRVVELLLEKAVVRCDGDERVTVVFHWRGGTATTHAIPRCVHRWSDLSHYASIVSHIAEMGSRGSTSAEIASSLNTQGYRTCRNSLFTSTSVRQLRKRAS